MRFSTARVCQIAPPEHWWAVKDLNLGCTRRVTGSTARRFQPLSQLPKRELSKIWRKAGDSNAYVPRDPGLADQWDTNYPSLPGKNYNIGFRGNYRLGERHQECPTGSRYDKKPRLKKRRICHYCTAKDRSSQDCRARYFRSGSVWSTVAAKARWTGVRFLAR